MDPGDSTLDQAGKEYIQEKANKSPNTLNEITSRKSPNLGEVVAIQDQKTSRTSNMTRKEPLPVKNSNQRKNIQSCKRKEPSYLRRQTYQY